MPEDLPTHVSPEMLEEVYENLKKRLPVRALQTLRDEGAVGEEYLEGLNITDATIGDAVERFRHPDFYDLATVIRDSLMKVLAEKDGLVVRDAGELFEVVDPEFRANNNPALSLVTSTLRFIGILVASPFE